MDLHLEHETRAGGVNVIEVSGELDVYTAPGLRSFIIELDSIGVARLVLDLSELEFIDSSGLGLLCGALKRTSERGGYADLVVPEESRVTQALKMTGLIKVFQVHPDLESAIAARAGES